MSTLSRSIRVPVPLPVAYEAWSGLESLGGFGPPGDGEAAADDGWEPVLPGQRSTEHALPGGVVARVSFTGLDDDATLVSVLVRPPDGVDDRVLGRRIVADLGLYREHLDTVLAMQLRVEQDVRDPP